MCMIERRQRGFTLIEIIIFIVVVGAGLAGILSVMNTVVASSADPLVRKQALAIAESLLEEILLKAYCDPSTVNTSGTIITSPPTCVFPDSAAAASRAVYDKVSDYNGYATAGGVVDVNGAPSAGLGSYNIASVAVDCVGSVGAAAAVACTNTTYRRVVVSVVGPGAQGAISLVGFRGNY